MYRNIFIVTALIIAAAGVACQPDDPTEQAADHLEDAGEELRSAAEDVGNQVEDACEQVKEEAGAADTDC